MKAVRIAILKLRQDAIARGMLELAMAYGWSVIRIGLEEMESLDAAESRRKGAT